MANDWDELLQTIKEAFPTLQITKNDLLHPTSTIAIKFYTNFIMEFQEVIQVLSGAYYCKENFNDYLESEEWIFQTMYHIFNTFDKLTFMLSDIYEPAPIRTKNFFRICCHLLSFTETIIEDTDIDVGIVKMKENTIKLENDHEQILSEIHLKATKISELSESKEKKLHEFSETKKAYEEMKDNMEQKEKLYVMEEKKIELLKQQLQKEEQKSVILEKREKELSEQFISESEYKNLLNTVEELKNHCNLLGSDQINMDDFLIHENNELVHYQDCRKRVCDTKDFDLQIVTTVIKYEEDLKDLQIQNDKLINDKINPIKLLKSQNEKNLEEIKEQIEALKSKLNEIRGEITKNQEKAFHKISKIKENMTQDINYSIKTINTLKQEINTFEEKMKKLKHIFCVEYNKVAKDEVAAKEYLNQLLDELNQ